MLFVWGDADPVFPLANARAMVDELGPRARLAIIPGAKLFAHEDHPEDFAASARPFLESTLA